MRGWLRSEAVTGTRALGMLAGCAMLAVLATGGFREAVADATGRIERIQLKTERDVTKVIVMLSRPLAFDVRVLDAEAQKSARRLVLDFANATLAPEAIPPIAVDDGFVRQVRTGQFTASTARIVLDLASDTKHSVEAYESPPHVTIAIAGPVRASDVQLLAPAPGKPGLPTR